MRAREAARAVALVALAAAAAPATAPATQPAAAVLAEHCRAREALSSLRARFVQTRVFTALGDEDRSSGVLYYRRPDAFRWEYAQPDGAFTVVAGRRGWAVFPRIRQARRLAVEDAHREGILSIVGFSACGPAFGESFEVSAVGARGGPSVLSMKPLRPEISAQFTSIELTLDPRDHLPRRVVLHEAAGDVVRLDFVELRRDVRIDGSLFEYAPPEDYEVMD